MRLRVLCPPGRTDAVLRAVRDEEGTTHVVLLRGAAVAPEGDVVEADVARESVDDLVGALRRLHCHRDGGIVLENLDTVVSRSADEAERRAPGEGIDAIVWDELLDRTGQQSRLSVTFVVMLTIACLLAAVGVVTNSPVTVVGAMVLGPEFGPLAALAVAVIRRRAPLARDAAIALVVGFGVAVPVTVAGAALGRVGGLVPDEALTDLDQVAFIYQVGPFSLVIALLAGVAGMVALLAGEGSGVLVGVFISLTTVPAAGFAAVAAVLGQWPAALASLAQLGLNVVGVVLAGIAVLLVARAARRRARRRLQRGLRRPSDDAGGAGGRPARAEQDRHPSA